MGQVIYTENDQPAEHVRLSVVIRCRNEAMKLRTVCRALQAQRFDSPWELIFVDNESDDDTREVCREFGGRVVTIPRAEFSYGRAINWGIRESRGELILLLSAHSIPLAHRFLQIATTPFTDPELGAARCLMIGNPDQIKQWYRPRMIQYRSKEEQQRVESGQQWMRDYPTAGCCILRRSVWEEIPFDEEFEANEDKAWASQVLAAGYKIQRCVPAIWLHLRKRTGRDYRRMLTRYHLGLYRFNGRPPLTLKTFVLRSAVTFATAPVVAWNYMYRNLSWYWGLAKIPSRVRSENLMQTSDKDAPPN